MIRDGAVVIHDERILELGDAQDMHERHADAAQIDQGSSILLPGLVNPHTHLELSACQPSPAFSGHFVDWIIGIRDRIKLDLNNVEASLKRSVELGVKQCLKFGVTCIGDISQQMNITRPLLRDGPLRVVSYGEVLGLARRRPRFDELFGRAVDESSASDRLRIGLSPHSPYTVDLDGYRQCLALAREKHLPLATHLSETAEEEVFLRDKAGAFQEMWQRLGHWAEPVPTFSGSPIEFASAIGLLDYPTLLAHVNYCSDDELELLSRGKACIIYCPRTHAYFGHPPHRWREMLARGINVAVGTDSCASSPDLNLIDDLRLLRQVAPDFPAQSIWEMATTRAARAIQMEEISGSIASGKAADLIAFQIESDDPLEEILINSRQPTAVWVAGQQVL